MFWEKAYTPSQNIEALLQKEDVKLEELLDDDDILQECKSPKKNLIQFFTRPDIIKRLIELTITEPPEDIPMAQRFKHANMACEVLTSGVPSLNEKLVENPENLQVLCSFLEKEPPLNPLLASFFNKTFCMLIWRNYDQDGFLYEKMCLQVLEFVKSKENFINLILKHFAIPVIMDVLLQIIKEVRGRQLIQNVYEWLTGQQLVERLINMLGDPKESDKHCNISEFLCELICYGKSIRQKDHEALIGTTATGDNPLLQFLEEEETISMLLDVILRLPIQESSVVAGISIVLTLIDESIVDEPASDMALAVIKNKEEVYINKVFVSVIKEIVPRLENFHNILKNPPQKNTIITPVTKLTPPVGQTRLHVCRLFTALMKRQNEDISLSYCKNGLLNTSLKLFKQYQWNNFLHSEIQKTFCELFKGAEEINIVEKTAIEECKILSLLIDCWMYNREVQSTTGRRLGYMGHLIEMMKVFYNNFKYGALIESNLSTEEMENWKNIVHPELGSDLISQSRFLANCDAYTSDECCSNLRKGLQFDVGSIEVGEMKKILDEISIEISDMPHISFDDCSHLSRVNWEEQFDRSPHLLEEVLHDWNDLVKEDFVLDDFADFDAHFNSFSSDLGLPLDQQNNENPNTANDNPENSSDKINSESDSPNTSSTSSSSSTSSTTNTTIAANAEISNTCVAEESMDVDNNEFQKELSTNNLYNQDEKHIEGSLIVEKPKEQPKEKENAETSQKITEIKEINNGEKIENENSDEEPLI